MPSPDPQAPRPLTPIEQPPKADPTQQQVAVEVKTKTLGEVPGIQELLRRPTILEVPTRAVTDPLAAVSGEGGPLDAVQFDEGAPQAPSSQVDALTFDNAGPMQNPLEHLIIKPPKAKSVTTTTTFVGGEASSGGGDWRTAIVEGARKMLGTPYEWGGTDYGGVDCSGLILLLFKAQGISMPRISADQARKGHRVSLDKLRPGDLVAWDNSSRNNGADHIAIYIGNGQIIEAPRPGRNVQISSIYDRGNAWGVALDF